MKPPNSLSNCFPSSKHHYREKETELTHDEEVMAASLHSYFGDLLKQTGPVRVDDTKFAEAMSALDPECRKLVARYQIQQQTKLSLIVNFEFLIEDWLDYLYSLHFACMQAS